MALKYVTSSVQRIDKISTSCIVLSVPIGRCGIAGHARLGFSVWGRLVVASIGDACYYTMPYIIALCVLTVLLPS